MAGPELKVVENAFRDWTDGTGHVGRIFAPHMTWEIVGRSAAAGKYASAAEFVTKVLEPFARRFPATNPFRPVRIRALYTDGPTVIVLWDGEGTTIAGTTYRNTYVWALTLQDALVVDGLATFDSIAFNELWEIVPRKD